MNNKIILLLATTFILLSACTQNTTAIPASTPQATEKVLPSLVNTPTAPPGCLYKSVQCIQAPCDPILVCESPSMTAKPKASPTKGGSSVKGNVQSYSTSNTTTNININSNGTSVKIISKNGKRYAELNGKEVELDANGCFDYDKDGTKIHTCVNN